MYLDIILLVFSLALILTSCTFFTNSVEWLGKRFQLSQGVVGSILAAVGTALPETIIPIIAIFSGGQKGHEIGIGAIAGAPFMLSTLAFFVTGIAVIIYALAGRRPLLMNVNTKVLTKDLIFFIVIYGIAVLTTFMHSTTIRLVIALMLLLSYLLYIKLMVSDDCEQCNIEEPLYLSRFLSVKPFTVWIALQLLLGLAGIVLGAQLFVGNIEKLSQIFGLAPLILSIFITPIATELPEKLNSIIWIGKNKDTLALGNITGAMVFQSCFPVAIGIIFTPWNLQGITMLSAILALSSAAFQLIVLKVTKKVNPFILLLSGLFYLVFIGYFFI